MLFIIAIFFLHPFSNFAEGVRPKVLVDPYYQIKKKEKIRFKNQKVSRFKWKELDTENWTDFSLWKEKLKDKEAIPSWRKHLIERKLEEKVGYVLDCSGQCRNYRGLGFSKVRYLSSVMEGDELQTKDDGHMWVFLLDGTLIRMAPQSSVTIREFNVGEKENFIFVRINEGNVLWLSRYQNDQMVRDFKETDTLFLPMNMYEANPGDIVNKLKEDDLFAFFEEEFPYERRYQYLNGLIKENESIIKKTTRSFIVLPNANIEGINFSGEFIVLTGGNNFVKQRSFEQLGVKTDESEKEAILKFRGHENTDQKKLEVGQWYAISNYGQSAEEYEAHRDILLSEFITKNIPTILIARELMIKKYSDFVHKEITPKKMALDYGYRLWGDFYDPSSDSAKRLEFLREYTRRMETTQLKVAEIFRERLKERGEEWIVPIFDAKYFQKAMGSFYNYREGVNIYSERKGVLNSERKVFWKKLRARRK